MTTLPVMVKICGITFRIVVSLPRGERRDRIVRTSAPTSLDRALQFERRRTMSKRISKFLAAFAALAALAVGGSAIASAQQAGHVAAPVKQGAVSAEPVGGPDTDSSQSGDQTTPDTVAAAARTSAAPEAPGTEQPGAAEQPGAPEQPGSESAANSDGTGGHADEPGNASADHQFNGAE
jgi:hypothetical protein